jgi:CRISPR-associated protein Cst1
MRQEQIDSIRDISNKIVALAQRDGDFKKLLTPIEGARYAHQLRTAILRMAKAHYKNGEPEPFVRLNDYVDYLFPDGQSWYEMRDLMLICLYEKLHDLRIAPTEVSDDAVSDIEDADQGSLDDLSQ